MKRDMDLLCAILRKIEENPLYDGQMYFLTIDSLGLSHDTQAIAYHLMLAIEAGLLDGKREVSGDFVVRRLTWSGHEFLEIIRTPEIWAAMQRAAETAGGFHFDLMLEHGRKLLQNKISSEK